MDMQKTEKVGYSKAVASLVVGLSVLSIYILACVSSPVAWSPDSSKIAILVNPPGEKPDHFAIFTYDISTGERTLLDKVVGEGGALSAPAWSPDGKWIAYYKVDPSVTEGSDSGPCDSTPMAAQIENYSEATPDGQVQDKNKPTLAGEQPFSEETKDYNSLNVKLMIVCADGNEQKVLHVVNWANSGDVLNQLMLNRPVWSPDSRSIFYVRRLPEESEFEICSLDLYTGKIQTYTAADSPALAVSPDGRWVASIVGRDIIVLAGIGENLGQCVELQLEGNISSSGDGETDDGHILWSADSKKIFAQTEGATLQAIDIASGNTEQLRDPDVDNICYPVPSLLDNKLYYLAVYKRNEVDLPEDTIVLRRMNLENYQVETMFNLIEFPKTGGGGLLAISPNGKMVLLRSSVKTDIAGEQTVFVLWDGYNRKVIETDRWLTYPLYTEEDLILDDKITDKWIGENEASLSLTRAKEEMTYGLKFTDKDGNELQFFAHLVSLKGMTFLGVFRDRSLMQQKDSQGYLAVPDVFLKVDRTEPYLLLRTFDYKEVVEMLNNPAASKQNSANSSRESFKGVRAAQYARIPKAPPKENAEPPKKEDAAPIKKEITEGKNFPDLKFTDLDGNTVDVSQMKSKVVIIDFWATWCGPCTGEIPSLVELYNLFHNKGLEIVGISLDTDRGKLKSFLSEHKMKWPQYYDGKGWQNEISSRFGVNSIPQIVLLGRDGVVLSKNIRGEQLKERVKGLFNDTAAAKTVGIKSSKKDYANNVPANTVYDDKCKVQDNSGNSLEIVSIEPNCPEVLAWDKSCILKSGTV